jgi:hypothetical protein
MGGKKCILSAMKRTDVGFLLLLIIAVVIIFYPVIQAEYLYSDEAVQLWFFKDGLNFNTSISQGRYLTYLLFEWVFSSIHRVEEVSYARIFSLFGWIICLPVWYYIINQVMLKNRLPKQLVFLTMIYLVCLPSFGISIGWASCMEMFIAASAGLISGYAAFSAWEQKELNQPKTSLVILLALVFGLISLFTYQNGFGCFLIPFFIRLVAKKKTDSTIVRGVVTCFAIYTVYFLLFKYSVSLHGFSATSRSSFASNPVNKLIFFLARPLASALHFTWLVNEERVAGVALAGIPALAWFLVFISRQKSEPLRLKISYVLAVGFLLLLSYLPSLLVKENYSSNRTVMALNLVVFILVAESFFYMLKKESVRNLATVLLSCLFFANAWYNFNRQFIDPLVIEFTAIKKIISVQYTPGIKTIHMILTPENAFEEEYGITRSWDEFGDPSTSKTWTPEALIKQLVYEKTGDRKLAEQLVVKTWANEVEFSNAGKPASDSSILVNLKAAGFPQN